MKGYGRKVFIVNSRADARGMERFKATTALFGEESLKELARLLGGDRLTDVAVANARQMREQALVHKEAFV